MSTSDIVMAKSKLHDAIKDFSVIPHNETAQILLLNSIEDLVRSCVASHIEYAHDPTRLPMARRQK